MAADKFGQRPFEKLKGLKALIDAKPQGHQSEPKRSSTAAKPVPKPGSKPAATTPPGQRSAPAQADADGSIETLLFAEAMAGVQPLSPSPARVMAEITARLPDPEADDQQVRAELTALVRGEIRFELSDTDEFIEGAVPDLDRRTRLRLKRGEFSVQAHLDLHGLTREEAHPELETFVHQQRSLGRRCVLIVHGRGKNSPDGVPVLKEQMGRWLSRGGLGKVVLGFCTARPTDGGAGALYVLLRR